MKKLNNYFFVSEEDADYALQGGTKLTLRGGHAVVLRGGRATVLKGGHATVREGRRANVWEGGYADVQEGGRANVWEGGNATVWEGGHAFVRAGGRATVQEGGHATVRKGGLLSDGIVPTNLAEADGYTLRTCQGLFQAGCSDWLTREEALARWDREDDRACIFTLAILSCDWGTS